MQYNIFLFFRVYNRICSFSLFFQVWVQIFEVKARKKGKKWSTGQKKKNREIVELLLMASAVSAITGASAGSCVTTRRRRRDDETVLSMSSAEEFLPHCRHPNSSRRRREMSDGMNTADDTADEKISSVFRRHRRRRPRQQSAAHVVALLPPTSAVDPLQNFRSIPTATRLSPSVDFDGLDAHPSSSSVAECREPNRRRILILTRPADGEKRNNNRRRTDDFWGTFYRLGVVVCCVFLGVFPGVSECTSFYPGRELHFTAGESTNHTYKYVIFILLYFLLFIYSVLHLLFFFVWSFLVVYTFCNSLPILSWIFQ